MRGAIDPKRAERDAHRLVAVGRRPQERRLRRAPRPGRARSGQHRSTELPRAAASVRRDPARRERRRRRELRALLRSARRRAPRRGWANAGYGAAPRAVRERARYAQRSSRRDLAVRPRPLRRLSRACGRIREQRLGRDDVERGRLVRAMKTYRLGVIAGDGIGPEVTDAALRVLDACEKRFGFRTDRTSFPWSGAHYLKTGERLTLEKMAPIRELDAVLLGAIGHPDAPRGMIERDVIIGLRRGLDLYVNLRPVVLYDDRLSPLKGKGAREIR